MSKLKLFVIGFAVLSGGVLFSTHSAQAAAYVPNPGDLVKIKTNPTVFLVQDTKQLIAVTAEAYAIRYNNNFSLVKTIPDEDLSGYPTFLRIGAMSSHGNGALIVYSLDNPEVFILDHGFKKSLGHRTDLTGVQWVGTYEIYPTK